MVSKILEYDSSGLIYWKCDSINPDDVATIFKSSSGLGTYDTLILDESRQDSITFKYKNKFRQFHKGIAVEYGTYIEHVYNGSLLISHGQIVEGLGNRDTSAVISKATALSTALASLECDSFYWEYDSLEYYLKLDSIEGDTTWYPKGELVFGCKDDPYYTIDPLHWKLCWKFEIASKIPEARYLVYVDALNGNILKSNETSLKAHFDSPIYGSNLYIDTKLHGGNHFLWANDAGKCIKTVREIYARNYNHNDIKCDADGNFGTDYPLETQAHFAVNNAYSYWDQKFRYKGTDGSNKELRITLYKKNIDPKYNTVTAYRPEGNPKKADNITFNEASNAASEAVLDVAGHEYSHAVSRWQTQIGHCDESGSINEGIADIWGVGTEAFAQGGAFDWDIGEASGWIDRNLKTPSDFGMPSVYKGALYWKSDSACDCKSVGQMCWSHHNSGVMSRWFVLLVEGGSNAGYGCSPVSGIGFIKAESILTLAATHYISEKTKYVGMRAATITAVRELYGACSNEEVQVCRAWANCNVGGCCECIGVANKPLNCWPELQPEGSPNNTAFADRKVIPNINLYPNPVENKLNITLESNKDLTDNYEFSIYDMHGKKLIENTIILNDNVLTIDTKGLSSGAYVLTIKSANSIFKLKFIKN